MRKKANKSTGRYSKPARNRRVRNPGGLARTPRNPVEPKLKCNTEANVHPGGTQCNGMQHEKRFPNTRCGLPNGIARHKIAARRKRRAMPKAMQYDARKKRGLQAPNSVESKPKLRNEANSALCFQQKRNGEANCSSRCKARRCNRMQHNATRFRRSRRRCTRPISPPSS